MPFREHKSDLKFVYENSPWVAEKLFLNEEEWFRFDKDILSRKMAEIVNQSDEELKLKLIRSHPKLTANPIKHNCLTDYSKNEQKNVGLFSCTKNEASLLENLNEKYYEKFSFPFIVCVKNLSPLLILECLQGRMLNSLDQEKTIALNEIHKIARIRISKLLK